MQHGKRTTGLQIDDRVPIRTHPMSSHRARQPRRAASGSVLKTYIPDAPDPPRHDGGSRLVPYHDTAASTTRKRPRTTFDDHGQQVLAESSEALAMPPPPAPYHPLGPDAGPRYVGGADEPITPFDDMNALDAQDLYPPAGSHSHQSEACGMYWYALSQVGSVFRLDDYMWVVQDWDAEQEMLRIGVYYHIVRLPRSDNTYGVACTCSRWHSSHSCIHQDLIYSHTDVFTRLSLITPSPTPPAVLIHSSSFDNTHIFSCISSVGRYESGKRAIVTLQRSGRWYCQSCRYSDACKHRAHAVAFAVEAAFISGDGDDQLPSLADHGATDAENALLMKAGGQNKNGTARCCCGVTIAAAASAQAAYKPAIIYGLTMRLHATIELLPCPSCKHGRRQIGPDLGGYGLFNWNNTMLFSHELLNAFTSSFTTSETPFSAFCSTVRHTYMEYGVQNTFCSDDTFVRVWFAFTRLQNLDSGMACPLCGPSPEIVIADGISLGTHHSKLNDLVCPPTRVTESSEKVESISSWKARALPAIIQADLRSLVHKLLERTATCIPVPAELPDMSSLSSVYPDLMGLIRLYISNGTGSPHFKAYRNLIKQIAAPDIVLQLIPFDAIEPLRKIFSEQQMFIRAWRNMTLRRQIQTRALIMACLQSAAAAEQMGDCNKFFKTYSKNNLTGGILVLCIRVVNTSAAECGNGGMGRIRKSVSFMVYDHAIQFTKVFLDIWNRNAINRMAAAAA
ncbi:hypothetical protein PLICRDRAFT_96050 [Plicaturopsis crispa FD-325 SS-3]|uniref:SWIM-type domain-containing protein n=1 Tax=Plicaturopsis crispa FD-325 SS-3 TaxID=944288 RepID=A0A0C9SPP6_PLICR|nr:hypothetical protein PLICRDRAFT_96050 [Plicaturopsis crispa FD-325 SS-3]